MPTKEELEQINDILEKKNRRLEKEVEKLKNDKEKNLNRNLLYQSVIGFALIVLSKYIENSSLQMNSGSGDLLIGAGVFSLTIQGILSVLRVWKGKK